MENTITQKNRVGKSKRDKENTNIVISAGFKDCMQRTDVNSSSRKSSIHWQLPLMPGNK